MAYHLLKSKHTSMKKHNAYVEYMNYLTEDEPGVNRDVQFVI